MPPDEPVPCTLELVHLENADLGIEDPVPVDAVASVERGLRDAISSIGPRGEDLDSEVRRALYRARGDDRLAASADENQVRLHHGGGRQNHVDGGAVDARSEERRVGREGGAGRWE